MDRARCLLLQSELPNDFWAEAVYAAVYVMNRSPVKSQENTPEEVWSGRKPTVSHLRIFGCKAYIHVPAEKRKKLDHRATPCIFVGYSLESKAYRFYDPKKRCILISRDVTFVEDEKGSSLLKKRREPDEGPFIHYNEPPAADMNEPVEPNPPAPLPVDTPSTPESIPVNSDGADSDQVSEDFRGFSSNDESDNGNSSYESISSDPESNSEDNGTFDQVDDPNFVSPPNIQNPDVDRLDPKGTANLRHP
uniref:Retroviral polymerase SH3-like domain-containing protein n=3 Tax=Lygus hesperus TaxID=30085 RepID=A0A0K8SGT5_LYGHE